MPPLVELHPVAQTLRWFFRPVDFMQAQRKRYGEIYGVRFITFNEPMYLLSSPAAIKAIYSEPANTLPQGREVLLEPLMGNRSILLQEGAEHLARRRLMLPPFHGERMRSYETLVREAIEAEMSTWPIDETFAIHPRMQAVTLEVILKAVFGVSEGPRFDRLRELLNRLLAYVASPGLQLLGLLSRGATERLRDLQEGGGPLAPLAAAGVRISPWAVLWRTLEAVDAELYAEIAARRQDPALSEREDILSMLIEARFEDGTAMDDVELRDQLMTLLLAGHETTATALAWTFDLLLRHPAAMARLSREVRGGDEDAYLRATISESLRLRPVIPIAGRVLAEETEIDGYMMPAGSNVAPAIWLAHTRADVYPEPFAFRPERFLETGPETYSWIPFGGGVRRCLGAAFAEFEMRIVICEMLRRFDFDAPGAGPEAVGRRNITFSPRHGTPLRARPLAPVSLRSNPPAPLPSA
jgi:cytochrome P450